MWKANYRVEGFGKTQFGQDPNTRRKVRIFEFGDNKSWIKLIFHLCDHRFKVETHKSKEMLEAAEKLRREKWIEEKTKKIKEMTVKGLEPEIQALINKHKNEIKSMKAVHEAELMQADERAAQRYIKITEELRENYEREKEAAIQRERDVSKQRYEKSLQDEEKSFLEQRRRLYAEIEEEKNRLAEVAAQQRKELDKQKRMLEENNFNAIEAIRKEYADNQKETEKKHQVMFHLTPTIYNIFNN